MNAIPQKPTAAAGTSSRVCPSSSRRRRRPCMPPVDSTQARLRPSGEIAASIAVPVVVSRSIETRPEPVSPRPLTHHAPIAAINTAATPATAMNDPIPPSRDVDDGWFVHLSTNLAQIGRNLAHRSVSLGRVLCEARVDDALETGGRLRHVHRQRRRVLLDDLLQRGKGVHAKKGPLPGNRLIQDASKREHVGAMVGRLALHLLGRDVPQCAKEATALGLRRLPLRAILQDVRAQLGDAKIENLRIAALGIMRFSGLRSRCVTPAAWAASNASATWAMNSIVRSRPSRFPSREERRVSPATSSMAMYSTGGPTGAPFRFGELSPMS